MWLNSTPLEVHCIRIICSVSYLSAFIYTCTARSECNWRWQCCVLYLECLPQQCLGWHPMVSVTVVTCWSLQALTEVKLVNTNVKPATSVAIQQGQQAFMCSSSCPVHVSLLAYLYSYRFIVSYQVNKNALQIILFAMFFTSENFSSL